MTTYATNDEIFDAITQFNNTSQKAVKNMLVNRFEMTDEQAQEYLWAYALR